MRSLFYGINILSFLVLFSSGTVLAQFQYISPKPGSKFHHTNTNIILRNGNIMDEESIHTRNLFLVEGSLSGIHELNCKLSDGGKTVLLQPNVPFSEGETVTVTVANGLRTLDGAEVKGTSFTFQTIPHRTPEQQQRIKDSYEDVYKQEIGDAPYSQGTIRDESQSGFPPFNITTNTNPAPGEIFFHNFSFFGDKNAHYCIIESNGDSVYGIFDTVTFNNFNLSHSGFMTAYNLKDSAFDIIDSNYVKVGQVQTGNGYRTDVHEFQMYSDRIFMMAYDPQVFDMTIYNPTYQEDAIVIGCIIQELDQDFDVVFQWRSWDHFEVLDASHQNFAGLQIDYVHGNSIELDDDGNLLLSCRHMDEITKISRSTGDIIWRLGGKKNQFTFIGTSEQFSYQHDARRIDNGHITLYDNGNYYSPPRSWVKEFALDEINKTATLVWSYSRTVASGNVFANAMGSAQRLSNGNTFICWGLVFGLDFPNLTEVDPAGNVVWELKLESNDAIYRAHRYSWDPCARPTISKEKIKNITSNSAKVTWNAATGAVSYKIHYKPQSSSTWLEKISDKPAKKLVNLLPATTYQVKIKSICDATGGIMSPFTKVKKFTTLPLKGSIMMDEPLITSAEIYPNPGNGVVNVGVDVNQEGILRFTVFDLAGRSVYSAQQQVSSGEQSLQFNLTDLESGVYLAEVKLNSDKLLKKLVIE